MANLCCESMGICLPKGANASSMWFFGEDWTVGMRSMVMVSIEGR
jgi:hypothetical protein